MAYGSIKVDNIIFTNGGVDQTITVSGIVASTSGNLTVTGTISGDVIRGGTTVSGATVTGAVGQFGNLTAVSGVFTTQVSGATVTGNVGQFTSVTGGTAGFTTVTGTTVTGTTANFVTVSGTTVTGTTANFTSGNFTSISGGTHTITSGVFAAGSATNPSISFASDPNTGIYSPGADQVAISTNGTGRLFVDASGNVGIGAAPSEKLHVSGDGIRIDRSGGEPYIDFYTSGSSNNVLVYGSSTGFRVHTGGSERLRVDSSGRLGLGSSAPLKKLHVTDTSSGSSVTALYLENAGAATSTQVNLDFDVNEGTIDYPCARVGAIRTGSANTPTDLIFAVRDGADNILKERVRLDSQGRLGIGTSPAFGAIDHGVHIYGSGAQEGIRLETTNGSTGILEIYAESGGNTLDTRGSGYLRFSSATTEWGRWDSSGRFLVGTSSTSGNATLHVNKGSSGGTDAGGLLLSNLAAMSSIGAGDDIGYINFGASTTGGVASYDAARILCEADGTWGSSDYPTRLVFSTTADGASSPTERMRIASGGYFKASNDGDYSPESATASVHQFCQTANFVGLSIAARDSSTYTNDATRIEGYRNTTNATWYFFSCYNRTATAYRLRIADSGNVTNTNNSYTGISDIRLKENVVDARSQWADIKALQVRNYNFKEETGQPTHKQIGLIAQEVELVSPGLVDESIDRDPEGNDLGTTTKAVQYSVLYMKAVKALQEAMERIEVLEQRLTDAGIA